MRERYIKKKIIIKLSDWSVWISGKILFNKLVIYWEWSSKIHLLPLLSIVFFDTFSIPSPIHFLCKNNSIFWLGINTIECNSCLDFICMFWNFILDGSDEFCFLSKKEIFWVDMPLSYAGINWSWILLHIFEVLLVC